MCVISCLEQTVTVLHTHKCSLTAWRSIHASSKVSTMGGIIEGTHHQGLVVQGYFVLSPSESFTFNNFPFCKTAPLWRFLTFNFSNLTFFLAASVIYCVNESKKKMLAPRFQRCRVFFLWCYCVLNPWQHTVRRGRGRRAVLPTGRRFGRNSKKWPSKKMSGRQIRGCIEVLFS